MNYSPLNDPGFKKAREEARLRAGKKRRTKTLILLSVVTLLAIVCTALLGSAVYDAVPNIRFFFGREPENTHTLPLAPVSPTPSAELPPASNEVSPSDTQSESSALPSFIPDPDDPNWRVTTVYVDAGHGYTNSLGTIDVGAGEGSFYHTLSGGLYEKDLNLAIALKVRTLLEARGYRVIMSRSGDVYSPLTAGERATTVANSKADCCVSIHANSSGSTEAAGTRVYYCDRGSTPLARQKFAESFATAIDSLSLSENETMVLEDHNVGVSGDGGYLLCNSTGSVPSILVETCFLTNEQDARKALDESWQTGIAQSIVAAIVENFPWSCEPVQ